MRIVLLIIAALAAVMGSCQCSYLVLMPKWMSYGEYPISITYLKPDLDETTVSGNIRILNTRTRDLIMFHKYELPDASSVSAVIKLEIGEELKNTNYIVEVTGTAKEGSFNESAIVNFKRKPLNIFIQTDKAMYKPSQYVNFRVLTMDTDLKPKPTMLTVTVHDPRNNIIKQWKNQSENAVFTSKFLLSDDPITGDWKILVKTEDEEMQKTFEVREYVLPKFEVIVEPPGYLLTTTKAVTVSVTAKYTYGKLVKGKCVLNVSKTKYSRSEPQLMIAVTKDLQDGKADFEVTFDKANISLFSGEKYEFSATCTEDLTKNAITTNKSVEVYSYKYKLKFHDVTSNNYKPGMNYTAYVVLSVVDGTPPKPSDLISSTKRGFEQKRRMKLSVKAVDSFNYDYPLRLLKSYEADIDPSGFAVFQFLMESSWDTTVLWLEAEFVDDARTYRVTKRIEAFFSRSRESVQVTLPDAFSGAIKANEKVQFMIKTSFQSSALHVLLLSRGKIVAAVDVTESPNTEHIYKLDVSEDIAKKISPKCQLLVWTLTATNELVADSISFNVDGAFSNQVQVNISPLNSQELPPVGEMTTTRPGDPVHIKVKAEPFSYIGLLVVDYAASLLGSNDITQDEVLRTLETQERYSNCDIYPPEPWVREPPFWFSVRRKRSAFYIPGFYFRSCGGRNSKEIISNAGLFVKTDIYICEEYNTSPPPYPTTMPFLQEFPTITAHPTTARFPEFKPSVVTTPGTNIPERTLVKVGKIRKDFPETWLFVDGKTPSDGEFNMDSVVPDSITTWLATAFSVHPQNGLDITDQPFQLRAFKPFFVTLDLPYSIIRDEEFELKIIIQNYEKSALNVRVTLEMAQGYFKVSRPSGDKYRYARVWYDVMLAAGAGTTVSVWIKPVALGNIPIEVKAQTSKMADALRRMILVEPEGAPQEYTRNLLIQSKEAEDMVEVVEIKIPLENLVPGSLKVHASVVGDVMGQAMNNLDHLIKMPYGCGEQNMLNFAPNIFIMNYLKASQQANPKVVEKAMKYTEAGYQRELNYQRTDGCFSAFGDSDREGSTWLTAFVLKSFWQGRDYLSQPVQENIEKGLKCLIQKQEDSGMFREDGVIYHKAMQGGTSSDITLTAYVTIALLELRYIKWKTMASSSFNQSLTLAQKYLSSKTSDPEIRNDPYTLAVIGYALALGDHEEADIVFKALNALAKSEGGQKYWEEKAQPGKNVNRRHILYPKASTHNVEIASYALLMYVELGKYLDGLSIMSWLIAQRNPNGGYRSTQDTVMALQALAEVAIKVYQNTEPSLSISVKNDTKEWAFPQRITKATQLLLQTIQLDLPEKKQTSLEVMAKGEGTALVQIAVKYNIYTLNGDTDIKMNITTKDDVDGIVDINVCASYYGDGESGMVVVEAKPLSGYTFVDLDDLQVRVSGLKRTEENDKQAVVYLDKIDRKGLCVPLTQERYNFVANIKQSRAIAYSYYDTDQVDSAFYLPQGVNQQDTCCPSEDQPELHFVYETQTSDASRMATVTTLHVVIASWLVVYPMIVI